MSYYPYLYCSLHASHSVCRGWPTTEVFSHITSLELVTDFDMKNHVLREMLVLWFVYTLWFMLYLESKGNVWLTWYIHRITLDVWILKFVYWTVWTNWHIHLHSLCSGPTVPETRRFAGIQMPHYDYLQCMQGQFPMSWIGLDQLGKALHM